MADAQTVEQTQADTSTTAEVTKTAETKTDESTKQAAGSTQRPDADKSSGWEAEKKAFIADLQKERKARQALEQEKAGYTTQVSTLTKRVQALAGVDPKSPEDTEAEAIRARLGQVVPWMGRLNEETVEKLLGLLDSSDHFKAAANKVWEDRVYGAFDAVQDEISKEIGGPLSERQIRAVRAAFVHEAEIDQQFLDRFDKGDKTLVGEFAKQWIEDWFAPARRMVTKQTVDQNRRVPDGRGRSIPLQGDKAIDVNDPKAVEDILVKGYQERGGQFGRR